MKKTILSVVIVLVPFLLIAQTASPLSVRKSKLKELSFLIGEWDVVAERKNAAGEIKIETGAVMRFQYDMDSTVIRNERHFNNNSFYEYIFFNSTRNLFEFISLEQGAVAAARQWLVDGKKKIYRYRFIYFDAAKQLTVETTVTLKAISENELVETFEGVAFETGQVQFFNTLKLTRK